MRSKTILYVAGAVLALLAILASGAQKATVPEPPADPAPGSLDDPAGNPRDAPVVDRYSLKRGSTLDGLLDGAGLDPSVRVRVLDALDKVAELRRIPAGAGVSITRTPAGEPVAVGFRLSRDRFIRITLQGEDDALLEEVAVPIETRISRAGGTVEHSVSQAFGDHPDGAGLIPLFAEIFQWDIDLLVEPRTGDQVRIVYESLYYAEQPDDLPPIRGSLNAAGDPAGIGRILAASYTGRIVQSEAFWVRGTEGRSDYFDREGTPLRKTFLKSPLNYRRISSRFSRARRNPVTRKVVPHHGVDFAADAGTPVVAAADGRVVSAGWSGALGKSVRIRHGSEYVTVYGHLSRYARGIRSGAQVRQNQVIGYVGSTGRATGPHLHYAMLASGRAVNPLNLKNPPVDPLPDPDRPVLDDMIRKYGPALGAVLPQ